MKFSIRDLLLVTVIVALGVGWWVDRRRLANDKTLWREHSEIWKARAEDANGSLESRVGHNVEWDDWPPRVPGLLNSSAPAPIPPKK